MNSRLELEERVGHETIDGEVRQVVWSPEQVALHLPIAGPATRMLAYGIDAVIIFLMEIGTVLLLFLSTPLIDRVLAPLRRLLEEMSKGEVGKADTDPAMLILLAAILLLQFLLEWSYFMTWEILSGGRSLGKLCVRLRVIRDDGHPLTARESLIRNVMRMVDLLPGSYLVGLVAIVMSPQGKRLGDLAAGTIVVRLDRADRAVPLLEDVIPPEVEQFRFERAQLACLGNRERTLLRQTLRRVDALPADKGEVLLASSVKVLCERIGYGAVEPTQQRAFLLALLYALRRM